MTGQQTARYLTWVVVVILAALALAALFWVQNALSARKPPHRNYHVETVEQLATGKVPWPYVRVIGRVRTARDEADGDTHSKLTGITAYIILECIPELPCKKPPIGARIEAWGIPREDKEHGWWEIHPMFKWELVK